MTPSRRRLLAWAGAACAAWPARRLRAADPLRVEGPVTPGGLLFVTAPPGTTALAVNEKRRLPAPDGRFLVGLPRDSEERLTLEAIGAAGPPARLVLPVQPRQWRAQRLPELGTTDTPTPEWQARREQEVARMRAAKLAAAHDQTAAAGYAQRFLRPAEGRVTGVYGSQRIFGKLPRPPHWGLDIANATGTPVIAPADAVVRRSAGPYLLEGNVVVLDHGGGLVSTYMHLSERAVATGARVARGDRIGRIGTTGRSTGPHLHWGLSLVAPDGADLAEIRLDPALLLLPAD